MTLCHILLERKGWVNMVNPHHTLSFSSHQMNPGGPSEPLHYPETNTCQGHYYRVFKLIHSPQYLFCFINVSSNNVFSFKFSFVREKEMRTANSNLCCFILLCYPGRARRQISRKCLLIKCELIVATIEFLMVTNDTVFDCNQRGRFYWITFSESYSLNTHSCPENYIRYWDSSSVAVCILTPYNFAKTLK